MMSTESSTTAARTSIHADTTVGAVHLTVNDLERSRLFYERVIGFSGREREDGTLAFGVSAEPPLVVLRGDSSAPALDRRATGLFHFAILMPSRRDLAVALARLAQNRWPLDGASDHLVSEALYLSDPDGNGIEIYRDRPRAEWRRTNGELAMATLPLDLQSLIGELDDGVQEIAPLAPSGTRMGHVHLQVAELEQIERFYSGVLGFDVVVRGYPGALFVSAGGYHHHLGLNTWQSAGSSPAAPGSVGLRYYEVLLPDSDALSEVLLRVSAAGIDSEPLAGGTLVRDPSGISVLLRVA